MNLTGVRQILGNAIGKAPKDKIFKKYIEMELQLGNIDRCRKLYEKYLEWSPENCYAWSKYAELEMSLGETDRARAIFELAIAQPALNMPELLWKGSKVPNSFGELGDVGIVQPKLPKKLKKRTQILAEDSPAGYEEYVD